MSVLGYGEEAWQCLGQASAVYGQLAQSLLPVSSRLQSQARQIQEKYYAYRVAGLATLAQAATVPLTGSTWPDTRSLLLLQLQAKLDQIARTWSDPTGQDSLTLMLRVADHALSSVQNLDRAGGLYEFPRKRFWWWYYPFEAESSQAVVSASLPRARGSARLPQSAERPKLEYIPGVPRTRSNRRGTGQPEPGPAGLPFPPMPDLPPPQR